MRSRRRLRFHKRLSMGLETTAGVIKDYAATLERDTRALARSDPQEPNWEALVDDVEIGINYIRAMCNQLASDIGRE